MSNLGLASHLAIVDERNSQLSQKDVEAEALKQRVILLEKCLKFLLRDLEIRKLADSVSQGVYAHASVALQTSVGVVDAPMLPEPTMVSSEAYEALLGQNKALLEDREAISHAAGFPQDVSEYREIVVAMLENYRESLFGR